MIFKGSKLRVCDESGIAVVKCLRPMQLKKYATVGDVIKVTVRKRAFETPILKRTLCLGLIVTVTRKIRRRNGICIHFERNNLILLSDDLLDLIIPDTVALPLTVLPREILSFKTVNLRMLLRNVV